MVVAVLRIVLDYEDRRLSPVGAPGHVFDQLSNREVVVGDAFVRELQRAADRRPRVADAQDVVPAAVECQASEAELRQHGRQPARRAGVEVHAVAVEEEDAAAAGSVLWLMERTVERSRVGRDRNQFRPHVGQYSTGDHAGIRGV